MKAKVLIAVLSMCPDADVVCYDEEGEPKEIRLIVEPDGENITFGIMAGE